MGLNIEAFKYDKFPVNFFGPLRNGPNRDCYLAALKVFIKTVENERVFRISKNEYKEALANCIADSDYEYDDEDVLTAWYFEGEQALTNAISAVTCREDYTVGVLTGHGEDSIPEAMLTVLGNMFINVKTVDIEQDKAIPSDVDVMLIITPQPGLPADGYALIILSQC